MSAMGTCLRFLVVVVTVMIIYPQSATSQSKDPRRLSYLNLIGQFKKQDEKTMEMAVPRTYSVIKECRAPDYHGKYDSTCRKKKPDIVCDNSAPFRTMDGTCNNLRFPEQGKSFTPQKRFIPAQYDDGIDSPRERSKSGGKLPSTRLVSNILFKQTDDNFDEKLTLMVMTWGQFAEHDIVFTPALTETSTGELRICCDKKPGVDPACFPIKIPRNDDFFRSRCMEFVRSSPTLKDRCGLCNVREQINELTSYIDGSNVYASTKEDGLKLRLLRKGLLLTSPGRLLPPRPDQMSCVITKPETFCLLAGDKRVQETPTLGSVHVTFVRFHNDIAYILGKMNRHWDDERIYQETRKITGAVQQKINFEEYLPAILDRGTIKKFCLDSSCQIYDEKVDASSVNSFGVTAFRFGHSQIAGFLGLFKEFRSKHGCPYGTRRGCPYGGGKRVEVKRERTEDTFKNPFLIFEDVDGLQLFQVTNSSLKSDAQFDDSIRDKLFLDAEGNSLDLAALDTQRGRDHGIPPYTKFRKFCGLSEIRDFRDLVDHDRKTIRRLMQAYEHVDDIDLFVGGMVERPIPGSILGPTFSCIMAEQYRRYKVGDRFWWERRDRVTGFSDAQLRSLRRLRFSKILCDMHDLQKIQRDVMFLVSPGNPLRDCKSLPPLDLRPWRETHRGNRGRYY